MTFNLKSVEEKLDKLLEAVGGRHGLIERMVVSESSQEVAKEEAEKSEARLVKAIKDATQTINEKLSKIPDRAEVSNIINAKETRRFPHLSLTAPKPHRLRGFAFAFRAASAAWIFAWLIASERLATS